MTSIERLRLKTSFACKSAEMSHVPTKPVPPKIRILEPLNFSKEFTV
jgi:hypothetical protein